MAHIALAELVGSPFTHNLPVKKGEQIVKVPQQRQVRVGALLNDETGDLAFRRAKDLPSGIVDAPHIPLRGRIFDGAYEGPSLATVLKRGASTPSVDIESIERARDATEEHLSKKTGFTLASTRDEIRREGERKTVEKRHGQEIAAVLQGGNKRPEKKVGFGFTRTPLEIVKERNRKKFRARQLKMQMKNATVEFP